jgi:hypothetical protein
VAEDWALAGYLALINPAQDLWERTLALTDSAEIDMAEIGPIAAEVAELDETRLGWVAANKQRATDRKNGGKLHIVNASTYGIQGATELRWACHVLSVLGDESQKALVEVGIQRATALHDDCYRTASESIQYGKVKPDPAAQWAKRIVGIVSAPETYQPSIEAHKVGGMPGREPWWPFGTGGRS